MEAAAGSHAYQIRVVARMVPSVVSIGAMVSLLFTLLQPPLFLCPFTHCSEEEACSLGNFQISPESNQSFTVDLNLYCSKKHVRTYLLQLFFIGGSLGALLIGLLMDRYGRQTCALFSTMVLTCCHLVIVCFPRLPVIYPILSIQGAVVFGAIISIGCLLLEVSEAKARGWMMFGLGAGISFGVAGMTVLVYILPNWRVLILLLMLLTAFSSNIIRTVPESPRFLAAAQGKYAVARALLKRICKTNSQPEFHHIIEGEKVIGHSLVSPAQSTKDTIHTFVSTTKDVISVSQTELHKVQRYSWVSLYKFPSSAGRCITLSLIWVLLSMTGRVYWTLVTDQFGDMILDRIGLALSDVALYSGVALAASRIGSFTVLFGSVLSVISISGLCAASSFDYDGVLGLFLNVTHNCILHISYLAVKTTAFSLFFYTIEALETTIRGMTVGVAISCALSVQALYPVFSAIPEFEKHSLFISFSCVSMVSFFLCYLSQRKMKDYTSEELIDMSKPSDLSVDQQLSNKFMFQVLFEDPVTT